MLTSIIRKQRRLTAILCLSVFTLSAAQAETYITTDRTVAGGNPLNSFLGSQSSLYIGQASDASFVGGVDVDIVTGAFLNGDLRARGDSRTTIYGGNFTHFANGYPLSGLTLAQTAQVRLAGNVRFAVAVVDDQATLQMDAGQVDGIQVHDTARARVTGGLIQSQNFPSIAEAYGAGARLELSGGQTSGVVRVAGGGAVSVSGGSYNNLLAYNGLIEVAGGLSELGGRLGTGNTGLGRFMFYGSDFVLSNPVAGAYYDPTYWLSAAGVFYTLTGTLLNGQYISASYFEEGLSLGQAPRNIGFSTSPVPEPAGGAMLALGLLLLAFLRARTREA